MMKSNEETNRRSFLKVFAGSPLLRCAAVPGMLLGKASAASAAESPATAFEITTPAQALNVFDLEDVARRNLPPAHFADLAIGVEADGTVRANREGFAKFQLRARRLVDTSRIDSSVTLFGTTWPTPMVLSPVSSLRAFHPEGDLAVARAARARNHLQILSTLGYRICGGCDFRAGSARSGSSSIPPSTGTSPRRWSSAPRPRDVRSSR